MRVDVPMLAITHCDSADVIGKFGAASEYTLCASQWAPTLSYRDDVFGSAADYAATFEAEYGYAPPYQAAESSAAVIVFADAFERAGGFDKDAVRDALAATEMQTFYGNIKFDETGQEHREAHGALSNSGRRLCRGCADQVGRLGGSSPDPAVVRAVGVLLAYPFAPGGVTGAR